MIEIEEIKFNVNDTKSIIIKSTDEITMEVLQTLDSIYTHFLVSCNTDLTEFDIEDMDYNLFDITYVKIKDILSDKLNTNEYIRTVEYLNLLSIMYPVNTIDNKGINIKEYKGSKFGKYDVTFINELGIGKLKFTKV